jgi:hypothetical protein
VQALRVEKVTLEHAGLPSYGKRRVPGRWSTSNPAADVVVDEALLDRIDEIVPPGAPNQRIRTLRALDDLPAE